MIDDPELNQRKSSTFKTNKNKMTKQTNQKKVEEINSHEKMLNESFNLIRQRKKLLLIFMNALRKFAKLYKNDFCFQSF